MRETDVDVVIVGSGAAGLSAALAARAEGARVLVAESDSVVGGATRLSTGWVMAADSDIQRAAKIDDSPETLYREYMFINQFEFHPGLMRRLAYDGAGIVAWLSELGVQFLPDVQHVGAGLVPRSHVPEGGGQELIDVMYKQCREQDIDFALGNRVDRLLVRDDAVRGAAVAGDELEAGAVVLATGGFGANRSLVAEHLPSMDPGGDWYFYIGPESSRGDGLVLGAQVGAHMVGHDRYVALPMPRVETKALDQIGNLPGWLLLVGPDGRRLCDETDHYGIIGGRTYGTGGLYGIFDEQTLVENDTGHLPASKHAVAGYSAFPWGAWSAEGIGQLRGSGAIVQADTIEDLAAKFGISAPGLVGTVRRYNESAALRHDPDFHKDAGFLRSVEKPPFYAVEVRFTVLGFTGYGIQIDEAGHALDEESNAIDGLFAAGECTGGILGSFYIEAGSCIGNGLTFGRAAGRSAARYALDAAARAD